MKFESIKIEFENAENKKIAAVLSKMKRLISELDKREVPINIIESINSQIIKLNAFEGTDKSKCKVLRKCYSNLLKLIEKELKLVTNNHYQNMWMALGMPFGLAFFSVYSSISGDYTLIGVGLVLGMVVGMSYGASLDKKAVKEGRQINIHGNNNSI